MSSPSPPISCLNCNTINFCEEGDQCEKCGEILVVAEFEIKNKKDNNINFPIEDFVGNEEKNENDDDDDIKKKALNDPNLRKKYLRAKINAMKQNRQKLTSTNQVIGSDGKKVKGLRYVDQPKFSMSE